MRRLIFVLISVALSATWCCGVCADDSGAGRMERALDELRTSPVQFAGRVMPLEVMCRITLRDLAGREDLATLAPAECSSHDPVFTFLSMVAEPERWKDAPLFEVAYRPLRCIFGDDNPERISFAQAASLSGKADLAECLKGDPRKIEALHRLLMHVQKLHLMDARLALFPPSDAAEPWLRISELDRLPAQDAESLRNAVSSLFRAFRGRDPKRTQVAVRQLNSLVKQLPGAEERPSESRVRVEFLLSRFRPFRVIAWLYVIPVLLAIAGMTTRKRSFRTGALASLLAVFALHTLALMARSFIAGRLPLANTYEYAVMTVWATLGLAILFERHFRYGVFVFLGALLGSVSLAVIDVAPISRDITPLIPALRSVWLQYHVLTIFIGYAAFMLAFAISVYYLIRRARAEHDDARWKDLLHANDALIRIGFLFLTIGIMTGCIWANLAWGRYWGWDPKEVWALVTWFIYVIYIHLPTAGWKRPWLGPAASCVGFAFVVFTYLGVTYLLSGLHSYGA